MAVTNVDNQDLSLKENIRSYFINSRPYVKTGICPTAEVFASSVDKWSMFVVMNLGYYQVLRFNELKHKIDGISARMLSVTLKKLEQSDIISRKVYSEIPPRVEYTLTPFGKGLAEKLVDLGNWLLENSTILQEKRQAACQKDLD